MGRRRAVLVVEYTREGAACDADDWFTIIQTGTSDERGLPYVRLQNLEVQEDRTTP